MDIRLLDAEPTEAERDAVDAFLGPPVSSWVGVDAVENGHSAHGGHAARAGRHQLLPALHSLHERTGWISPGALNYIAARLTVPPADVYGVATFYALFSVRAASQARAARLQRPRVPVCWLGVVDRRAGGARRAARVRARRHDLAAEPVSGAVRSGTGRAARRVGRQSAGARVDDGEHRGSAGGDRRSGPATTSLGGLAAGRVQGASSDAADRSRRPRELG